MFKKNKDKKKGTKKSVLTTRLFDFVVGFITSIASLYAFMYVKDSISSANQGLVFFLAGLTALLVFVVLFVPWFLIVKKYDSDTSLKEWEVVDSQ